jgi:hypothetical protein
MHQIGPTGRQFFSQVGPEIHGRFQRALKKATLQGVFLCGVEEGNARDVGSSNGSVVGVF